MVGMVLDTWQHLILIAGQQSHRFVGVGILNLLTGLLKQICRFGSFKGVETL